MRTTFITIGLLMVACLGHSMSLGRMKCRHPIVSQKETKRADSIRKLWTKFDEIKNDDQKAVKAEAKRLLLEIEAHLYENSVHFDRNTEDDFSILIKVLPPSEMKGVHPLNRMARSFFDKYRGARLEINPMKLKEQNAGALFDDGARLLTLASDNVIDLAADSFVGHELRHAFGSRLTETGQEHVFMGWLKRKVGFSPLHETYPDALSIDELAAYYYQVIVLLRESRRQPNLRETVLQFAQTGNEIAQLFNSKEKAEVLKFAETYVKQNQRMHWELKEGISVLTIDLPHHDLQLEFNQSASPQQVLARIQELNRRATRMAGAFQKVVEGIEKNKELSVILSEFSEGRDLIQQRPQGERK